MSNVLNLLERYKHCAIEFEKARKNLRESKQVLINELLNEIGAHYPVGGEDPIKVIVGDCVITINSSGSDIEKLEVVS